MISFQSLYTGCISVTRLTSVQLFFNCPEISVITYTNQSHAEVPHLMNKLTMDMKLISATGCMLVLHSRLIHEHGNWRQALRLLAATLIL